MKFHIDNFAEAQLKAKAKSKKLKHKKAVSPMKLTNLTIKTNETDLNPDIKTIETNIEEKEELLGETFKDV